MRKILALSILFFLFNCTEKASSKKVFKVFEISYTNGWTENFSIVVFENRKIFKQQMHYELYESTLSDSTFKTLVKSISNLKFNKIKPIDEKCLDCAIVSLKIKFPEHTFKVRQRGNIDPEISNVIKILRKISDSPSMKTSKSMYFYETQKDVLSPDPKFYN